MDTSPLFPESTTEPIADGVDACHRDETCLVLVKPAGMPSVPGRGELSENSLAQRVQAAVPDALVVHRLDMATSGLMLMAQGAHWQRVYSRLFADRAVYKRYVAVVAGQVDADHGEMDWPLAADWPRRPLQMVDKERGKPSLTRYGVLSRDARSGTTRLALEPVTGRSHQLRVHLLTLGHPILGDGLYAPPDVRAKSARLLLHAQCMGLTHPLTGQPMRWCNAPPF